MDVTTKRETLHRLIDEATDEQIIGTIELIDGLKSMVEAMVEEEFTRHGLLPASASQPDRVAVPFTMQVDDTPAAPRKVNHEERREHLDQLAREAMLRQISKPRPPLPPPDDSA